MSGSSHASTRAVRAVVARALGGAVGWTLVQHAAYFVGAWLVSTLSGAGTFGVLGQALALALVGSLVATVRLEYAAQLDARDTLADTLFAMAASVALAVGVAATVLAWGANLWWDAPAWAVPAALAIAPLGCLQVMAARYVRATRVVAAARLRAAPALAMLPMQLVAGLWLAPDGVVWTLPLAAWSCWAATAWRGARAGSGAAVPRATPRRRYRRLARARWRFVRNEWPSLLLNTSANHGQVLLVGALAGDVAAGSMALALRIAMLPTSALGPALTDWLRGRVVATQPRAAVGPLLGRVLPWLVACSVVVYAAAAAVLPFINARLFPQQEPALTAAVQPLLWLGALRLAISPLTFLLAWRGWYGLNLLGQSLLFAAALAAALLGASDGGVPKVAWLYTQLAAGVYVAYLAAVLRAVRRDT